MRYFEDVGVGDAAEFGEYHVTAGVVDERPSASRPDRGDGNTRVEGVDGDDEVAISWIGLGIFERTPDG